MHANMKLKKIGKRKGKDKGTNQQVEKRKGLFK